MPEQQEWIYYEVMWRNQAQQGPMPRPWWTQQYFRRWVDDYDGGLFPSKEASFCSNALYRYWNMVGVKNTPQECLIGQSGEIEPVYDEYSLSFFLFEPAAHRLWLPQRPGFSGASAELTQGWQDSYYPVLITNYSSPPGFTVQERVLATTVGVDQKSMALARFTVTATAAGSGQRAGVVLPGDFARRANGLPAARPRPLVCRCPLAAIFALPSGGLAH
jgi:hypothetical protein